MLRITLALTLLGTVALADGPKFELVGNELKVPYPITYATAKDTLKPESADAIAFVAVYLDAKPYVSTLRVEVHTDARGDDAYNQTLSEKRALAVAKALVARGADCKRLIPVGFGATKPIADNGTEAGRAANRRTSFVNAALKGKAIGGQPLAGGGVVAGDPCN